MKILMVGLGGIGQRHVRNLKTLLRDEVELLAYRTRQLQTVLTDRLQVMPDENLETLYQIQSFTDLGAGLEQKPEIAFICNPSSMHVQVALKAAQAGCHLFVEKPLSHTTSGVQELIDTVQKKSLVGYVGYQMRFHPCLVRAHDLLVQKAIGRVLSAQAEVGEFLPGWHTYEDYRQMYAARRDLGGGVILSQIHEMDYLYWFFGLPIQVYTVGGHLSHLEVDVEDVASTLMQFKTDGNPFPVYLHQDYIQRPPSRSFRIVGDEGRMDVDLNALSIQLYSGQGELIEDVHFETFQRNQLFLDELAHFLACVRGEVQPLVTLEDGLQSLRMALAARKSLETGKVVVI